MHAPAHAEPVRVDRAKHAGGVLHVEDVGVAVDEEVAPLTISLHFHHREHLRETGLRLVAERLEDWLVGRVPCESGGAERGLALGVLGLSEEPGAEIVAEVGADSPVLLQLELLDPENRRGGRQHEVSTDDVEKRRNRRLLDLEEKAVVEDAASDFLAADLLHQRIQLALRPILGHPTHGVLLGLRCPEHSASLN